jgi:hypothetical protein
VVVRFSGLAVFLCEPFFVFGANVLKLETHKVSVLFDGLSALESVSLSLGQNENPRLARTQRCRQNDVS